jgi:hypothetical protein
MMMVCTLLILKTAAIIGGEVCHLLGSNVAIVAMMSSQVQLPCRAVQ